MTHVKTFKTIPNQSAKHMGSGDLNVLATPAVVSFAENTCKEMAMPLLDELQTTVGTEIKMKHLRASKIGTEITVEADVVEQASNSLSFTFCVKEGENLIAEGTHHRAIVDVKRFMERLNK